MKMNISKAIAAAAWAATIVACFMTASCEGRKMDNMEPRGETVEVKMSSSPDAIPDNVDDSARMHR